MISAAPDNASSTINVNGLSSPFLEPSEVDDGRCADNSTPQPCFRVDRWRSIFVSVGGGNVSVVGAIAAAGPLKLYAPGAEGSLLLLMLVAFVLTVCFLVPLSSLVPREGLHGRARLMVEAAVVAGWLLQTINIALKEIFRVNLSTGGIITQLSLPTFYITPIHLMLLARGSFDSAVLRLLTNSVQWWAVLALVGRIIVCYTLWLTVVDLNELGHQISFFSAGLTAVVLWFPLLVMPCVDLIQNQSRLFRLGMPSAFVANVGLNYWRFSYDSHTIITPLIAGPNASDPNMESVAVGLTANAQLSSSLFTLVLLMVGMLVTAARNPDGGVVQFPLQINIGWTSVAPLLASRQRRLVAYTSQHGTALSDDASVTLE